MSEKEKKRACLGAFAGAHGVKGETKVKPFTEAPENIAAYGPVETEDGARTFTLIYIREAKPGLVLARAPEIRSREDAERLKGVRFYVDREKLPAPDDEEFYLDDLVGLAAVDEEGAALGVVKAVYNFGAGDLIELGSIPGVNGVRLIPFTKKNVPLVDLEGGRITLLRDAISISDEADDPRASESFIEAAMREEDA